jgi:hypothetical protein
MPTQRDCLQYPDAPLRVRPIRKVALPWALTLLFCTFVVPLAQADPERDPRSTSSQFTTAACYDLVQDAGRMIAWARWERHFSVEKTRSAGFRDNTPQWVIELVQDWIADAYQWRATDQQVLEWASELGRVENLPRADQLTTHQAIAIWMRRIARQCNAHSPHA